MQIIDAYVKGTPSDVEEADRIVVDEDGLVRAGSERTQWTWMDAARDGVVFTPRHGKAVEINALWCHVLIAAAMWSEGPDRRRLTSLAAKAGAAFAPCFWRRAVGYLADHVWTDATGTVRQSTALRPNQIFAASLEHVPLDLDQRQSVVDAVRCKLLTPFGLTIWPTVGSTAPVGLSAMPPTIRARSGPGSSAPMPKRSCGPMTSPTPRGV